MRFQCLGLQGFCWKRAEECHQRCPEKGTSTAESGHRGWRLLVDWIIQPILLALIPILTKPSTERVELMFIALSQ